MTFGYLICPLLSFLIVGIGGRWLGTKLSQIISCIFMAGACFTAGMVFKEVVLEHQVINYVLFNWIDIGDFKVNWGLYVDTLSALMIMVVTTISFLVHVYSVGYMSQDRTPFKFMAYLGLFTFMMLVLVSGNNLLQIFFGWEGVGLASYLLIGYWYERPAACMASVKAFVVNRVGDVGLVLGIGSAFLFFKSLDISTIVSKVSDLSGAFFTLGPWPVPVLEIMAILLFIGAMGKSAQLGLHTWLPDAMEGPTPVSALIHAATMVTAGIFLVARFSALYELAPFAKQLMTYIGAITAVFAGTIAITQQDIKRVIAYSTCSQLGYMFFAEGLGAYHLALFHLTTHAFFKALLFLGAGSVIHAMSDEQDMFKMGGIKRYIPVTYVLMVIGSAALAGIPFFAGYYSKDAILETALHTAGIEGKWAYILGLGAVFLTAFYSWRLLYLTFHGKPRADEYVMGHLHEPGFTMLCPLVVLALGAIFSGVIGNAYMYDATFWQGALPLKPLVEETSGWTYVPLGLSLLGIGVATYLYIVKPELPEVLAKKYPSVYQFSFRKWYVDELYERLFIQSSLKKGAFLWKNIDGYLIDNKLIKGLFEGSNRLSKRFSQLHTGLIGHYALWMLAALAMILYFLIIKNSLIKG